EKKHLYGWIKTDSLLEIESGKPGILSYRAKWENQNKEVLLEERTRFEFSGNNHKRIIDRVTTLTASQDVLFKDAKDGLLGLRLAQELQIPTRETQKFKDDKGNETIVKVGEGQVANGNYRSSEGKTGDDVWSTRAAWCMAYGKMNNDSVSVAIIDHPQNPNYPTYWHTRGYGLFAANPLGENIFTNGKLSKNLHLQKGQSVTFKYRLIIDENKHTLSKSELDKEAKKFAKK
ncbi:MAG: PmoA family protein, partial [Ginsengibacter sp.]